MVLNAFLLYLDSFQPYPLLFPPLGLLLLLGLLFQPTVFPLFTVLRIRVRTLKTNTDSDLQMSCEENTQYELGPWVAIQYTSEILLGQNPGQFYGCVFEPTVCIDSSLSSLYIDLFSLTFRPKLGLGQCLGQNWGPTKSIELSPCCPMQGVPNDS